jgi:hypothetical protein
VTFLSIPYKNLSTSIVKEIRKYNEKDRLRVGQISQSQKVNKWIEPQPILCSWNVAATYHQFNATLKVNHYLTFFI